MDGDWGASMRIGNTGSGDWFPSAVYTKKPGAPTGPNYFYGIRIRLSGPRYLDVPGIVVTPVLADSRDIVDQPPTTGRAAFTRIPRTSGDIPTFTAGKSLYTGGSGGITCTTEWNDEQDESDAQNIIVVCYDRLTRARITDAGPGRYNVIGFNFVIAGPRAD